MENNEPIYKIIDINNALLSSKLDSFNNIIINKLDVINERLNKLEQKNNGYLTNKQKEVLKYVIVVIISIIIGYFNPNYIAPKPDDLTTITQIVSE